MSTPDENDTSRHDEQIRGRSAQERDVTAPTPKDVRAKAEDDGEGQEEPEPPAADTQAP